jgi:hypothetical protein
MAQIGVDYADGHPQISQIYADRNSLSVRPEGQEGTNEST